MAADEPDGRKAAPDGPAAPSGGKPDRAALLTAGLSGRGDWRVPLRWGAILILVAASVVLLLLSLFGSHARLPTAEFQTATALKVAALGLLVLLITFLKEGWVVTVLLLSVLSLLLPTSDVIRLVTIATRPDATIADLYPSNEDVSVNTLYRSEALTNVIIGVVRKNLEGTAAAAMNEDRLRGPVRTAITDHEIQRLVETVTSWSLEGLVLHLGEAELAGDAGASMASWVFRYGDQPQFQTDVARLRGLGLIRMNYDDVRSIALTWIGKRVADGLENQGLPRPRNTFDIQPTTAVDPFDALAAPSRGCPTNLEGLPALSVGTPIDDVGLAEGGLNWFELTIETETALVITAVSATNDPVLFLCQAGVGAPLASNDDYETISYHAWMDAGPERIGTLAAAAAGLDRLRWSDAAILMRAPAGQYLVGVKDYWGDAGTVTVAAAAVQP